MNFGINNLHPSLAEGIEAAGDETPALIQARVIPQVINGEDKDMVRAVNRIIGYEIKQRIISTFEKEEKTIGKQ